MSETDPGTTTPENEPTEPTTAPATEPAKPAEKDWQSEAERWKGLSRKNESDYKAAQSTIGELTKERDTAKQDLTAAQFKASQDSAVSQLHTALARAGVSEEDAQSLVDVTDSSRLLADGAVNTEAITKTVTAFARSRGTVTPDPDMGRRDEGKPKKDMNALIRAAVHG